MPKMRRVEQQPCQESGVLYAKASIKLPEQGKIRSVGRWDGTRLVKAHAASLRHRRGSGRTASDVESINLEIRIFRASSFERNLPHMVGNCCILKYGTFIGRICVL